MRSQKEKKGVILGLFEGFKSSLEVEWRWFCKVFENKVKNNFAEWKVTYTFALRLRKRGNEKATKSSYTGNKKMSG